MQKLDHAGRPHDVHKNLTILCKTQAGRNARTSWLTGFSVAVTGFSVTPSVIPGRLTAGPASPGFFASGTTVKEIRLLANSAVLRIFVSRRQDATRPSPLKNKFFLVLALAFAYLCTVGLRTARTAAAHHTQEPRTCLSTN